MLVVPTVAIGGALLFGGENSPWARFFAPLFGQQIAALATTAAPPISEGMTSALVFLFVIAGFAIAWWRYASADARRNAVERLTGEAERMPAVLANRFYC